MKIFYSNKEMCKKKINFKILVIFLLTILYFAGEIIIQRYAINFNQKIYMIFIFWIGILLSSIIIFFQKKDLSIEKKFIIIALFIGIIYIFEAPLLYGIDETAHFSRIYSFFFDIKTTENGDYKIPNEIINVGSRIVKGRNNFEFINKKIDNNDLKEAEFARGARLYTPISYLPYLIPVWIFGFLIKTNIFTIIISARFFGFFFYLFISILAIKTIPKRKEFLALFCLMPSVISSATTITADLLTNMSIIVFIAIWYKLYYDKKKITVKDIIIIIIAGILAGYAKMVYTLEFLLLFFLPKECFGSDIKKKAKILGIIVGFILIFTIINVLYTTNSINNSYNNMNLQKEYIFSHPFEYLKIVLVNILDNYKFIFSFTTNYTVLHNIFRPNYFIQFLYFIALLICIYKEEVDLKLKKFEKVIIYFIAFLIIFILFTSLYLQWTSENFGVGGTYIDGVQSRYYIPVMLMLLIMLPSKKDVINIDYNIVWYISLWVNITILMNIIKLIMV